MVKVGIAQLPLDKKCFLFHHNEYMKVQLIANFVKLMGKGDIATLYLREKFPVIGVAKNITNKGVI